MFAAPGKYIVASLLTFSPAPPEADICGFEMSAAIEWIALKFGADVFRLSQDELQELC